MPGLVEVALTVQVFPASSTISTVPVGEVLSLEVTRTRTLSGWLTTGEAGSTFGMGTGKNSMIIAVEGQAGAAVGASPTGRLRMIVLEVIALSGISGMFTSGTIGW